MADVNVTHQDKTPPEGTKQTWKDEGDGTHAPQVHVANSLTATIASGSVNANVTNASLEVNAEQNTYSTIACGELAGTAAALQLPSVACKLVKFKARLTNTGAVYLGGAGVTKPDNNTDVTTGLELNPGDDSGWLPVSNLNVFYRICDSTADRLTYLAMVS